MNKLVNKRLVDEAMDAYVDWREECAGVWDAYDRCARAPVADAPLAFSAYREALDREECASRVYAGLVTRIETAQRTSQSSWGPLLARASAETDGDRGRTPPHGAD